MRLLLLYLAIAYIISHSSMVHFLLLGNSQLSLQFTRVDLWSVDDPCNYRPISVVPVIAKISEEIVSVQLT